MKKKELLVLLGCLCLVLSLAMLPLIAGCAKTAPTTAEVITLKTQTFVPAEDMSNVLEVQPMFDLLEKALKDRVVLERYPLGGLCSDQEMLPSVSSGAMDFAPLPLIVCGELPDGLYEVELLPMTWFKVEDAFNIYYKRGMVDLFRDVLREKFNLYYIGPGASGSFGFSVNFPVHSLKDFKGKKILSLGAEGALLEAMGASPTWVPVADIYMALKLGTIDGIYWTFHELQTMKFKEVCHYVVSPIMSSPGVHSWLMNLDRWNALPPDVQQTFEQVIKENFIHFGNVQVEAEAKVFADPEITVCELPSEDVAFMKDVCDKIWYERVESKGPLGAKAIQIIKSYYGR